MTTIERPTQNARQVYRHPDQGRVTFDTDALRLTIAANGGTASIDIGPVCLIELGEALIELGKKSHYATTIPAGEAYEAAMEIYTADSLEQAQQALALRLAAAFSLGNTDAAAGAVAGVLIHDLARGMAAMPFVGSTPGALLYDTADDITEAHRRAYNARVPF